MAGICHRYESNKICQIFVHQIFSLYDILKSSSCRDERFVYLTCKTTVLQENSDKRFKISKCHMLFGCKTKNTVLFQKFILYFSYKINSNSHMDFIQIRNHRTLITGVVIHKIFDSQKLKVFCYSLTMNKKFYNSILTNIYFAGTEGKTVNFK
jgi:hypothetical protein